MKSIEDFYDRTPSGQFIADKHKIALAEIHYKKYLRTYIAVQAMNGLLSNPEGMEYASKKWNSDLNSAFERVAERSVILADHLINQLNSSPTQNNGE